MQPVRSATNRADTMPQGQAQTTWRSVDVSPRAVAPRARYLGMILSENRCPSRIKSGTGFFGIMP
jgi:hypothetical protein